ncbi:MAG: hypothetical protein M1819_007250 [Sarea resinae]|nr:MAG: hypothetical protein M1819_007250 [Sarea resinae]
MVYDINTITYLRRVHHICGVLIGSIPQIPQQNVFLGVPLQLMFEEAKLLIELGAAYVVDDWRWHMRGVRRLDHESKAGFFQHLEEAGREAGSDAQRRTDEKRKRAVLNIKNQDGSRPQASTSVQAANQNGSESLFHAGNDSHPLKSSHDSSRTKPDGALSYAITPTTSKFMLPSPPESSQKSLVKTPISYWLFAYLHSRGYYVSPGLRFGCQYLVYPGDPLRFHSHFLAVGAKWDEDLDLQDIVGGGRLGTGVKKGYLIGGAVESKGKDFQEADIDASSGRGVRTFCIEWGGM